MAYGAYNQERDCYECPTCGCRRFEVREFHIRDEICINIFCCGCRDSGCIGQLRPGGLSEKVHEGIHAELAGEEVH